MRTDTLLAFYSPPFPSQIQFCPTREIMGFWTQVAIFAGPGALYTVMAVCRSLPRLNCQQFSSHKNFLCTSSVWDHGSKWTLKRGTDQVNGIEPWQPAARYHAQQYISKGILSNFEECLLRMASNFWCTRSCRIWQAYKTRNQIFNLPSFHGASSRVNKSQRWMR